MAQLVLFGATGYAGSKILDEAVSRGHHVTAVARNPEPVPAGERVRPVAGSLYDAALAAELAREADALVVAVPAGPNEDGTSLLDTLPVLVEAAAANGARVGVVGGASSLLVREGGPTVRSTQEGVLPPEVLRMIDVHIAFLARLRETPESFDWFYLSPPVDFGAHVPGERLGRYRLGTDVLVTDAGGRSAISAEDYALALLDEIETPRHHRASFTVGY